MTSEAKWALFYAKTTEHETPRQRTGRELLASAIADAASTNSSLKVLDEHTALLPMPHTWPTLCQCVEAAHNAGLEYVVLLLDHPILTYPPNLTEARSTST